MASAGGSGLGALPGRLVRKCRRILEPGQEGDGRERMLLEHVLRETRPGDLDGIIAAIDEFATRRSWLRNVGPEKGAIVDAAVRGARPVRLLELGTYCGYSALRIARVMPPNAHLWSVERSAPNARIAREIWRRAGITDRVTCVEGWLGDRNSTRRRLAAEHGFAAGNLDFVFIDHDKRHYLPDLRRILDQGWLHPGSVVLADNLGVPGAPDYQAFMRAREADTWRTIEHHAHVEYQPWRSDVVLESTYLGAGAGQTGTAPSAEARQRRV